MTIKTSDFAVATAMPGIFLGRNTAGNTQVPLSILQTYIQQIIASTASNAGGAVNFRQAWVNGYDYAPNDMVSYNGKIYLMIGTQIYTSTITPDQDPTYWLCLFGQQLLVADMNTLKTGLAFYTISGAANAPASASYGFGIVFMSSATYGLQLLWSNDGNQFWTRQLNNNVFGSWVLVSEGQGHITPQTITSGTTYMDLTQGKHFLLTVNAAVAVGIVNWPAVTNKVEFELEIVNGGAFATTWAGTINWILSNGTTSTSFSALGITLNSSGSNFFRFWSRDGGTTVYGVPIVG
jgi:hypothetical protein